MCVLAMLGHVATKGDANTLTDINRPLIPRWRSPISSNSNKSNILGDFMRFYKE